MTDLWLTVPLDHAKPGGKKITMYVKEVLSVRHVNRDTLPPLIYLEGGPGYACPKTVIYLNTILVDWIFRFRFKKFDFFLKIIKKRSTVVVGSRGRPSITESIS